MKLKAFTIIELIIAVIIVGVLATLAVNQYHGFIEDADAQVCETNLKALQTSLDIYALEHDTIPASISEIPDKYLEKAFASIFRQKGSWKIKLAYLVVDWKNRGFAYAQTLDRLRDLTKGNAVLLRCPKAPAGENSYGFNSYILGQKSSYYRRMKKEFPEFLLVADFNSNDFAFSDSTDLTTTIVRHRVRRSWGFSQVTIGGIVCGYNCGVTINGKTLRELAKENNVDLPLSSGTSYSGFISDLSDRGLQIIEPTDATTWPEKSCLGG